MDPVTREEMYLAYMAGDTSVPLPEPVTRLEKFWYNVAMNGGGGGGGGVAGVSSFNGRSGAVKPASGDYDAAMVGAADSTLSNITDHAKAVYNLGAASNPNLLDNWYFADPIDQRQGYVVPPDTPYYSDTGLTTQAGTVSAYTTAVYGNGTYGTITVDSLTYYVDWTAAVRGYVGPGYGIDRWTCWETNTTTIEDGYVTVTRQIGQIIENGLDILSGKTVTISALLADGTLMTNSGVITPKENSILLGRTIAGKVNLVLYLATTTLSFQLNVLGNDPVSIVAVKLELGPVQTLARQDENGKWALNDPPPNKALELAKCQRYYFDPCANSGAWAEIGHGPAWIETDAAIFIPTPVPMRANPSVVWSGNFMLRGGGLNDIGVGKMSAGFLSANGVTIGVTSSGLTNLQYYGLFNWGSETNKLGLSADL